MVTKEQIIAALEPTKLPCVRITPEPDGNPSPTDSKFGGDFYLPAGAEVPELEFLAQINFAQVPRLEGFPEKGLLQFFLCTEAEKFEAFIEDDSAWRSDTGFFQVCWYPEAPADGPAHPDAVPKERWAMEKVTGGMKFELAEEAATLSVGGDGDSDFTADMGFEDAADAVSDLFMEEDEDEGAATPYDFNECSGLNNLLRDFGNWGIKLGGHPAIRYDDIRLEEEDYQNYTTLLFQFDLTLLNGEEIDTFRFFIRPKDLKECRFHNILMTWDNCY